MRPFNEPFPNSSARSSLAPPFADYVEDVVLGADSLVQVAIPAGARFVVFSFPSDIRVRLGTAATTFGLPNQSSQDGTGSELNPAARRIPATLADGVTAPSHLCLRAPAACKGSLAFYG